jgi:hypothetical protein
VLLSGIVGGAIALLGAFFTNRANTVRQKMQHQHEVDQKRAILLRERGEELNELIDKWLIEFSINYLRMNSVMQGKLTYREYYELGAKEIEPIKFGRLKMLVDVYFPSTRSAYDKIMKGREEVVDIDIKYQHAYDNGDADGSNFLPSYVQAQVSIEQAGEAFKAKIIECIRAI